MKNGMTIMELTTAFWLEMKPNPQEGFSDLYCVTIRIHSLTVLDLPLPHHLPQKNLTVEQVTPFSQCFRCSPLHLSATLFKSILAFKFLVPHLSASLYLPISTHIYCILLKPLPLQYVKGFLISLVISLSCTHIWRSGAGNCRKQRTWDLSKSY